MQNRLTKMLSRRPSGVRPLRRARLAIDPKLRHRHLQEGRLQQDEAALEAARQEASTATHAEAAAESQAKTVAAF